MIIWLRQHATEPLARDERLGVGIEGDVVRRESLARIAELDEGYLALQKQHAEVLSSARDEAASLIADATAETNAMREAAQREFDSARQRGFEAGRREAIADWYRHTAQILAHRSDMQRLIVPRVGQLVVAAVEKIVAAENPASLFERAAQSVERIVDDGSYLRVHVHPDEHGAAQIEFNRIVGRWREMGRAVPLLVKMDRTLARGDCRCESDIGSIDASLDVQLDAIRAAVARAVQHADLDTQKVKTEPDAAATSVGATPEQSAGEAPDSDTGTPAVASLDEARCQNVPVPIQEKDDSIYQVEPLLGQFV